MLKGLTTQGKSTKFTTKKMNKTITKFLRENYLSVIAVIAIIAMIIFIGNDPESKTKWATHVSDMTIGDLLGILLIYTIFRNK